MSATNETRWMSKHAALEFLGIEDSTFFVACKRHEWLAKAVERKVRHPETGQLYTRIKAEAVERYAAERKAGGNGGDHPGQFKYTCWLSEEELEKAQKALTKALGREVELGRLYKGKGKADAAETDAETDAEGEAPEA